MPTTEQDNEQDNEQVGLEEHILAFCAQVKMRAEILNIYCATLPFCVIISTMISEPENQVAAAH
jgi:hypothetical protein